jgi:soluble lytic murein transglycosylase
MLCLLVPATAGAEIYKYVDESGVVMLTDTPTGGKATLVEGPKKKTSKGSAVSSKGNDVQHIIAKKADKYSLDPALINAVIRTESAYDTHAISHKGAMGLMQLMPGTARELGVNNPFNPEENIDGGVRYLKKLIKKYDGDVTRALAAYNAGPRRAESSRKLPKETRNYIKKIYSIYNGERRLSLTPEKETAIYRVVLDDGQVLFTNNPPIKKVPQSL